LAQEHEPEAMVTEEEEEEEVEEVEDEDDGESATETGGAEADAEAADALVRGWVVEYAMATRDTALAAAANGGSLPRVASRVAPAGSTQLELVFR
jgi:hypothetical protein